MPITALPTPPSRNDPANFANRADAFLGALPAFATEANQLQTEVNASQLSASNSAAAAIAASSATAWVSGTNYTAGTVVYDTGNFLSYRRKVSGVSTVTPSADPTRWALLAWDGTIVPVLNGGTGASNKLQALINLGALTGEVMSISANYTVTIADRGEVLICTNTISVNLDLAATLGKFSFAVINKGTGIVTIDPTGTEQIDGGLTKLLIPGQSCIVICDGTEFRTLGLSSAGATGGGSNKIFYENDQVMTADYTIPVGKNAATVGPLTINTGVTLTVSVGSVLLIQ